ncbi:ubiquitin-associated protein 1 [Brachyhypopomus gauderio]|uniref:ubiquitin-associated protein 1 n=1 Tax=Brachyhypopomus gauderio TaxID=698409 RepID=UPI004043204A
MDARKSGSDIHNNGPISYLDDVPFKLNEKFRCPAKVGLPIGFCMPDRSSLLSEMQYDFCLEKLTVRWGEDLAKVRASETRAAEAQPVESEIDGQNSSQDSDVGLAGVKKARSAEEQDLLPPALNPVLAGLRHNAILTPLPAPSFGPAQPVSNNPAQNLNLADFEREEDPFDKLELKTLDDKEELRSILQSQPQSSLSPPEPPPPEPLPPSQSSTPPLQAKAPVFHKPNGLVGLLDLERPVAGVVGSPRGQIDAERPCNIRSLTFPKLSDPGDSPTDPPLGVYPAAVRGLPNGTPPSLLRSTPHTGSTPPVELPGHAPNGTTKQTHPAPAAGPFPYPAPSSGVLHNLSPSERQCVETIVGMGYSYEGVLRAMQRQGQNVEQVLEYLFVHSRLCERGFDASAVEECLEMYQCSEEKALQFLQLMSQFGEMGFERDAIKEVLLVHNNDQDKALEDLMARAAAS